MTHLQMWGLNGKTHFGICCGSLGDLVTHLQMCGLNGETHFGICCGSLGDLVTHLADVETLWGKSSDSFADVETHWGDLMTHL